MLCGLPLVAEQDVSACIPRWIFLFFHQLEEGMPFSSKDVALCGNRFTMYNALIFFSKLIAVSAVCTDLSAKHCCPIPSVFHGYSEFISI